MLHIFTFKVAIQNGTRENSTQLDGFCTDLSEMLASSSHCTHKHPVKKSPTFTNFSLSLECVPETDHAENRIHIHTALTKIHLFSYW